MNRLLALVVTTCVFSLGCGRPDKAVIENKVRDGFAQKPEWKNVAFEMKADTVAAISANRTIGGVEYWFSFTGGDGTGGVAVSSPATSWMCKYRYEKDKEVHAEKMEGGKEEDIAKFRSVAAEFAAVCIAASS